MENWRPQLQFATGTVVIVGHVCGCGCRWPRVVPLKGGPWFEPFCEWGGHRAKGHNSLQLATESVEENLPQKELQHQLAPKSEGFGIRRDEASWGSNSWAWMKLCPGFSQVWEMGWMEAECGRLYAWWYSVYPHANIVFSFLISLHETTHLWFAV